MSTPPIEHRARKIAERLTDDLHPLDWAVFGVTKASCRRVFRPAVSEDPSMSLNRRTAVQFLV
jgi:hypothetical protein